jgi:hypothetical protein
MRTIDADKLPITNTYALVNSKDVKPNEISFAPLVCVLKSDIDNAPTVDSLDLDVHIGGRCCGKRQRLLDELRPKGKWITHSDYPDRLICPNCNHRYDVWFIDNGTFCPNCGSDNRGDV